MPTFSGFPIMWGAASTTLNFRKRERKRKKEKKGRCDDPAGWSGRQRLPIWGMITRLLPLMLMPCCHPESTCCHPDQWTMGGEYQEFTGFLKKAHQLWNGWFESHIGTAMGFGKGRLGQKNWKRSTNVRNLSAHYWSFCWFFFFIIIDV